MSYYTVLATQNSASKDTKVSTVAIYKIKVWGYTYMNISDISLILISRSVVYNLELCNGQYV